MTNSAAVLSPPDDLDKISQLPDDILLKFLSILGFKNAVQTSTLAKRWRYLWTWRTDLDLDPVNMSPDSAGFSISKKIGPQGYLKWVNRVVDAHRCPYITKFNVFLHHLWSNNDLSLVEKWVIFAFSKRVEELDLNLFTYPSHTRFSLGFDLLKNPLCCNGIVNLRSLRLSHVNLSGETLEFILLTCHLLEQLVLDGSDTLLTLNITSDKLKHLTLIYCMDLKVVKIDAVNLISFRYEHISGGACTQILFERVPSLVDVGFAGDVCFYPFPILEKISGISKQLTNFSFRLNGTDIVGKRLDSLAGIGMLFPNVKQLTLTVMRLTKRLLVVIKFFIEACPMLHELKLQAGPYTSSLKEEAKELLEIGEMSEDQNSHCKAQGKKAVNYLERKEYENNTRHPYLKVLEYVGFHGCEADVKSVLDIIAFGGSIETLICDQRYFAYIGQNREYERFQKTDDVRRRACKLAKLLEPKVQVGLRYKSGLLWVS